jgi:simple sugar transport system permease protein
MLTGGVGLVVGTLFGGLIEGQIQTLISFQGSLTSWWTKIVIGVLLLLFIVMQRFIVGSVSSLRQRA